MIGQKFGRLKVVSELYKYGRGSIWKCVCDCGKEVDVRGGDLRSGCKSSCGCAHHGYGRAGNKRSPTYTCWAHMIQRCTNPNDPEYANYGARGITVCERWRDFRKFLADLGEKPKDLSLDRKNNEGNYEPGNCMWATSHQQSRNHRRNVWVEIDGKAMVINDAAKKLRIAPTTLYMRIARGWAGARMLEPKHKPDDPKGPKA